MTINKPEFNVTRMASTESNPSNAINMPNRQTNAKLTHSWLLKQQLRTPASLCGPRVEPKTGKRVKNKDKKTTISTTPMEYLAHWVWRLVYTGELSKTEAKDLLGYG